MCEECPPAVLALAKRIYDYVVPRGFTVSGGLHIVIEDGNIQSDHLRWCLETQNLDAESAEIANAMLKMTAPERHWAVQMAWESRPPWAWDNDSGDKARLAIAEGS